MSRSSRAACLFAVLTLSGFLVSPESSVADCLFASPFSCIKQSNVQGAYPSPQCSQYSASYAPYSASYAPYSASYAPYSAAQYSTQYAPSYSYSPVSYSPVSYSPASTVAAPQNLPIIGILELIDLVSRRVGSGGGGGSDCKDNVSTGDLGRANATLDRIESKVGKLEDLINDRMDRNEKEMARLVESQEEIANALNDRIDTLAELVKTNTDLIETTGNKSMALIETNTKALLYQQERIADQQERMKGLIALDGEFDMETTPLAANTPVYGYESDDSFKEQLKTTGEVEYQILGDFMINKKRYVWVRFNEGLTTSTGKKVKLGYLAVP